MKKNVFCGILLVLAAVIAVGSFTVFGPCVHEDGSEAACTAAGRAILVDGCLITVLAILTFLLRTPSARIILFAASLCLAAVGILLPGTLFPVCRMDTMHCRAVMQPAAIILFAAAAAVSAGGILAERSRVRRGKA